MNRMRMSLTGVFFFATREVGGEQRRTASARAADELGGVRVIDRDRQRLGMNVVHKPRHSGSRRRSDVAQGRD